MFFEFQTYITNLTVNNYIIFLHYHNNKQLSQRIWYFIIFKILKIPLVLLIPYQKNSTKEREKKDKFLDTIKVPQSFYKISFNQAIIVIFRDQFHLSSLSYFSLTKLRPNFCTTVHCSFIRTVFATFWHEYLRMSFDLSLSVPKK